MKIFLVVNTVGWIKSQIGFIKGRQALLEQETAALTPAGQEAVQGLFAQFDSNIAAAEAAVAAREKMSFVELATAMGY